MDKTLFAVRVTRHNKSLWLVRLEMWRAGVLVRCVERRDQTFKKAMLRARVDFKSSKRGNK